MVDNKSPRLPLKNATKKTNPLDRFKYNDPTDQVQILEDSQTLPVNILTQDKEIDQYSQKSQVISMYKPQS